MNRLELPKLLDADAVWTDNKEFFHICWNSSRSMSTLLSPMAYIITDNSFLALNYTPFTGGMTSYCANVTRPSSGDNIVFIITVSQTALPSLPSEVIISGK